ncbi:MAG: dethiobiotin synthase, partial [Gammaproteobacteria bacterium]|nr:dethiobiotin synthase [Gammaproteobacteria bacterium]
MTRGFFITGADTGVGKTWVALGLLKVLADADYRTAAFKPVACGGIQTAAGLRNEDALLLGEQAALRAPYDEVNPYFFAAPIAPHLAARDAGIRIELPRIKKQFDALAGRADRVIVEGAGGWLVPLNERETMADMARLLGLPVVLVVGVRLGCLNHALLTVQSIVQHGVPLAGWVANAVQPEFTELERNIAALRERITAPCLGSVPYLPQRDVNQIAAALDAKA